MDNSASRTSILCGSANRRARNDTRAARRWCYSRRTKPTERGDSAMRAYSSTLLIALCAVLPHAHAQTGKWPERPVRVVVPFAPGGATDIVARLIAPRMSEEFGQQFVVDNRPGAGGSIGVEIVVRANPDGHTILVGASSYSSNAALYKLSFDPLKDIQPVTLITHGIFIMTVHPSVKATNIKELIALARAKPNSIS